MELEIIVLSKVIHVHEGHTLPLTCRSQALTFRFMYLMLLETRMVERWA